MFAAGASGFAGSYLLCAIFGGWVGNAPALAIPIGGPIYWGVAGRDANPFTGWIGITAAAAQVATLAMAVVGLGRGLARGDKAGASRLSIAPIASPALTGIGVAGHF